MNGSSGQRILQRRVQVRLPSPQLPEDLAATRLQRKVAISDWEKKSGSEIGFKKVIMEWKHDELCSKVHVKYHVQVCELPFEPLHSQGQIKPTCENVSPLKKKMGSHSARA